MICFKGVFELFLQSTKQCPSFLYLIKSLAILKTYDIKINKVTQALFFVVTQHPHTTEQMSSKKNKDWKSGKP